MIKREELGKENVTEGSNEVGSSEFHRAESILAEGFLRDLLQGHMPCFAHRSERKASLEHVKGDPDGHRLGS